jgi:1,4-dihydroxy-2-naphthoate octaprenyltransferase
MLEWRKRLQGLGLLLRPIPVLSWSGGACLLGIGLALRTTSVVPIARLLRLLAIALVVQGWLAHSLNDRVDWQSGTDQTAAEILSGGSGALKRGYLRHEQLLPIAALSLLLVLALVYRQTANWLMYLYLAVGLWGAITYSHPSWRLAYKPLTGEWVAAFPAIVACTLAFYQGFAGRLDFFSIAAAMLHGLLSISWLMQHHLPDWYRDLHSSPPKRTTIAHVAAKSNLQMARLVVVGYFLLTALVASIFSLVNQRFAWTAWLALLCAALAYRQDTALRQEMARRELQMVGLTLLHAFVLGWML